MADEQFVLTREGRKRLEAELAELQQEQARLSELLGDVSDDPGGNIDADEAGAFFDVKTDLERVNERLGHIRFVLERAVVHEEDPNPKRVDPGERVVVWDVAADRERVFDLLTGEELQLTYDDVEDRVGVSADSPVGQALVGAKVGDVVEVETPDGKARYAVWRIEQIE